MVVTKKIPLIALLILLLIIVWGTFVIVPAGHRGVVLWWGSVEKRIMGEGLNFKVPLAERVIKVDPSERRIGLSIKAADLLLGNVGKDSKPQP
jgi:regulator of protease activity HflC (stomatin/prohibitin superfamily)